VRRALAFFAVLLSCVTLAGGRGEAHKPITSPYTYNEDVFPILRERCGRCHVAGGVAPMSLLSYKDAFPWGESIRTELIAGHMPPGTVGLGSSAVQHAQNLSAKELNVLLTWATGGNPIGSPDRTPSPVVRKTEWPLGAPDLILKLPSTVTLDSETQMVTREFSLPTGLKEDRWIRAVDLLPETPAVVRSATVAIKGDSAATRPSAERGRETLLSLWLPGEDPATIDNAAFKLPAGAELSVRIRYKKTWEYERKEMTDRSDVGLYFAKAASPDIRAVALTPAAGAEAGSEVSFSHVVTGDERALAVYADPALANARVILRAVGPDGSHTDLIRFQVQPDWARRYWFAKPFAMPRGTRIEGTASFVELDTLVPPGATPLVRKPIDPASARITINVAD
jgi:hypothetical protein